MAGIMDVWIAQEKAKAQAKANLKPVWTPQQAKWDLIKQMIDSYNRIGFAADKQSWDEYYSKLDTPNAVPEPAPYIPLDIFGRFGRTLPKSNLPIPGASQPTVATNWIQPSKVADSANLIGNIKSQVEVPHYSTFLGYGGNNNWLNANRNISNPFANSGIRNPFSK